MMSHRHFISRWTPQSESAATAVFAAMTTEFLRDRKPGLQKAELNHWEDEGGSLAVPVIAPLSSNKAGDAYVGNIVHRSLPGGL